MTNQLITIILIASSASLLLNGIIDFDIIEIVAGVLVGYIAKRNMQKGGRT